MGSSRHSTMMPLSLLLLLLIKSLEVASIPQKPNIVLLVLDDIGWADVGFHGSNFPTPNIDELAQQGVKLNRMYTFPQCSPTRSSILTGRYAFNIGMQHYTTLMPGSHAGIPQNTSTLAEVLSSEGYETHAIGKWHLGSATWAQTPSERGFQSYMGYLQGQCDYYNHSIPSCAGRCFYRSNCQEFAKDKRTCITPDPSPYGAGAAGYDFWEDKTALTDMFQEYSVDKYQERFEAILAKKREKTVSETNTSSSPLFIYFAQQLLHLPLQVPPESKYLDSCRDVVGGSRDVNRTVLCSMAARLDDAVGQVAKSLKDAGIWNETIVWAVSDNGGMTHWQEGFPASASSNWPLRGGKTTLFEGGVRSVSFLFGGALPEKARGTGSQTLMHVSDIFPTIASGMVGLDPDSLPSDIDGYDAWEAMVGLNYSSTTYSDGSGGPTGRTEIPLNIAINRDLTPIGTPNPFAKNAKMANYTALLQWPWKLILGTPHFVAPGLATLGGWFTISNYTYIPPEDGYLEETVFLFNLEDDESEHRNLAKEHPDIVQQMTQRVYSKWLQKDSGYVSPQTNIPHRNLNPRLHDWLWAPAIL